jgi:steroid delta-isomerase-like uncharacterized protein
MTHEAAVALLAQRERAFRERNPDAMAPVYADDAVLVSPMFGTLSGRDAIHASHVKLFAVFLDMRIDTEEVIFEDDRGVQAFTGHASHTTELFGVPPSGRSFELRGTFVFDFRNGKISRERRLYDFTGLLLQLGVLKPKSR